MTRPFAAALAFAALGALFSGTLALLLFNPRNRSVRWWAAFQAANMVWLGAQGWAFSTQGWSGVLPQVVHGTVHVMGGIFLGYTLVDGARWPTRRALAFPGLGVLTLPLTLAPGQAAGWFSLAWHVALWGGGTLVMMRCRMAQAMAERADRQLRSALFWLAALVGPLTVAGYLLVGWRTFVYAMPLLVIWVQTLIFVGVARLRFYDIEVRARRTGELAADAAERERLAVVGELAASLAHEIRNPLTGVRSLTQRLAEDEIDPASRRRYAAVILQEAERVERLVANLLGVARRAPRTPTGDAATPLADLFADLQLLLGSRARRAGVRLAASDGGLAAAAPRELLTQAVLNLLLNALAHSPAGGVVELSAVREAGATVLRVRDQGAGIAPEQRERIWEPFYTTGGGTGLGLAVVRRLAREAGWAVEVDDAPGGGAEFRLRVPEAAGRPAAAPVAGPLAAGAAS